MSTHIRQFAPPETVMEDQAPDLRPLEETDSDPFRDRVLAKLEGTRFDHLKILSQPPVVYRLNGVTVATRGNVAVIKGPEKMGKSAVLGSAIASAITTGDLDADTLGFTTENPDGHMVLHIDCEQSDYHHAKMMHSVLRRARVTEPPAWLDSRCLRGMSPAELAVALELLLAEGRAKHGGIHSVWIDGFSDLLIDVNDTKAVAPVVASLMALSKQYDTVIWGVIHQNPGQDNQKARGVLGSELQRKVETVLAVAKEGSGYEIFTALSRNAPITKGTGARYEWDDTHGMFVTDRRAHASARELRKQELRTIAADLLPVGSKLTYVRLVEVIMEKLDKGKTGSKALLKEMRALEVIQDCGREGYGLAA